jgi:leucyl aminopeptidase
LTVSDSAQAVVEGGMLGLYRYEGMKSTPPPTASVETLDIVTRDAEAASDGVHIGKATAEGTILARDLANTPPNICTPAWLADQAETMAKANDLTVNILKRKQIEALKMGALLAVAQGSSNAPRFIVIEHRPEGTENQQPIVLIGKGVTFDTGGYSLKTGEGMLGMKMDMSGGAAIIGAMYTISRLNWQVPVVGLVPASDNMVDERSYQPTDVITASNGKTIEIISTDAEGRLLLADALVYAKRYNPAVVIDIATLTGAVLTALGHAAAGLFSTDETLSRDLQAAGEATYERVWPLPLYPEYQKLIDSDSADMKNSSTAKVAGSSVGAIFLKNFIDYPAWAHIDMAGKMTADSDTPYMPTGASGYGVRLLTEFVRRRALKK